MEDLSREARIVNKILTAARTRGSEDHVITARLHRALVVHFCSCGLDVQQALRQCAELSLMAANGDLRNMQ